MNPECGQQCPGCPVMESLTQELTYLEVTRQRAIDSAHMLMGIEGVPSGLLNKGGMGERVQNILAEKFVSFKQELGKDLVQTLENIDEEETRLGGIIQVVPESCGQPRERKQYLLFGQTVLQCTSKDRRTA